MICTIGSDATIRTSGRAVGIANMSVIERSMSAMRLDRSHQKTKQQKHNICMICWAGELEQSAFASWWFGNLWLNNHDHVGQVNLLSHKCPNVQESRCKDWLWQYLHFDDDDEEEEELSHTYPNWPMFKKTVWAISFSFCWRKRKRWMVTKQSQHICDLQEEIPWWVFNKKPSHDPDRYVRIQFDFPSLVYIGH